MRTALVLGLGGVAIAPPAGRRAGAGAGGAARPAAASPPAAARVATGDPRPDRHVRLRAPDAEPLGSENVDVPHGAITTLRKVLLRTG
jgi:hypothetical protein